MSIYTPVSNCMEAASGYRIVKMRIYTPVKYCMEAAPGYRRAKNPVYTQNISCTRGKKVKKHVKTKRKYTLLCLLLPSISIREHATIENSY